MSFKRVFFSALVYFISFLSQPVLASGCMWYEKFEIGKEFPEQIISGKLKCSTHNGNYILCQLFSLDPQVPHFKPIWIPYPQKPQEGVINRIKVDVYEAMRWEDCDGSDPIPSYKPNVNLFKATVSGQIYEGYIPLKKFR